MSRESNINCECDAEYVIWHTPYITLTEMYDKLTGQYMSFEFHIPKKIKGSTRATIYRCMREGRHKYHPAYWFVENEDEYGVYDMKTFIREQDENGELLYRDRQAKTVGVHHMYLTVVHKESVRCGGVFKGFMKCAASLERVRPGVGKLMAPQLQREYEEYMAKQEELKRKREARRKQKVKQE